MKKLGLIIALVSTLITTVALATDRRVNVTNRSNNTVVHLYGSNVNLGGSYTRSKHYISIGECPWG